MSSDEDNSFQHLNEFTFRNVFHKLPKQSDKADVTRKRSKAARGDAPFTVGGLPRNGSAVGVAKKNPNLGKLPTPVNPSRTTSPVSPRTSGFPTRSRGVSPTFGSNASRESPKANPLVFPSHHNRSFFGFSRLHKNKHGQHNQEGEREKADQVTPRGASTESTSIGKFPDPRSTKKNISSPSRSPRHFDAVKGDGAQQHDHSDSRSPCSLSDGPWTQRTRPPPATSSSSSQREWLEGKHVWRPSIALRGVEERDSSTRTLVDLSVCTPTDVMDPELEREDPFALFPPVAHVAPTRTRVFYEQSTGAFVSSAVHEKLVKRAKQQRRREKARLAAVKQPAVSRKAELRGTDRSVTFRPEPMTAAGGGPSAVSYSNTMAAASSYSIETGSSSAMSDYPSTLHGQPSELNKQAGGGSHMLPTRTGVSSLAIRHRFGSVEDAATYRPKMKRWLLWLQRSESMLTVLACGLSLLPVVMVYIHLGTSGFMFIADGGESAARCEVGLADSSACSSSHAGSSVSASSILVLYYYLVCRFQGQMFLFLSMTLIIVHLCPCAWELAHHSRRWKQEQIERLRGQHIAEMDSETYYTGGGRGRRGANRGARHHAQDRLEDESDAHLSMAERFFLKALFRSQRTPFRFFLKIRFWCAVVCLIMSVIELSITNGRTLFAWQQLFEYTRTSTSEKSTSSTTSSPPTGSLAFWSSSESVLGWNVSVLHAVLIVRATILLFASVICVFHLLQ